MYKPSTIECTCMIADDINWFRTNTEVDDGTNMPMCIVDIFCPFQGWQRSVLQIKIFSGEYASETHIVDA